MAKSVIKKIMTKKVFFSFWLLIMLSVATVGFNSCNKVEDNPNEAPTEEPEPNNPSVSLTTDPGVKINGVIWATRNVDKPGTFTANPEDPGMFYQWNSKVGWRYNDPLTPSDGISTWNPKWNGNGSTTWEKANDPCPPGWRIPTQDELNSLMSKWTSATVNGMNGFWCGTTGAVIFLPCAGERYGNSGSGNNKGTYVELVDAGPPNIYWCSGRTISGNVSAPLLSGWPAAVSVRPVKE